MSISNKQSKLIRSLRKKKYRKQEGLFVAEGRKVVKELIESDIEIQHLFTTSETDYKLPITTICTEKELKQVTELTQPDEVLAIFCIPDYAINSINANNDMVAVLDGIKDPGNMGTMIRIADWFGFTDIICSEDCVDVYNAKAVQATMGSLARVRMHYHDLPEFFKSAEQRLPVYACEMNGNDIYSSTIGDKGFFIMGSESHGIRADLRPYIDQSITIPSYGKAESLNAAMAMAVVCSEIRRKSALKGE